jgi:hypothetical protein
MFIRRSHLGAAIAALLLSGCSTISNTADSIWSSISGEDDTSAASSAPSSSSGGAGTVVAIPPSPAESNPQPTLGQAAGQPPALGTGSYATAPVTPGSPTGTLVGAKVVELRGDLQRLRSDIGRQNSGLQQLRQTMAQDAAAYYSLVGTINSRLQIGTTPGNPQLVAQWNQAQGALDRMSNDVARLNSLSNQTASDSSLAAYIVQSIRAAYQLQGAVDEDHRQLRQLETEVNSTTALIDQLLGALSDDISRQTAYVSQERANLVTLSLAIKNGELYGQSLSESGFGLGAARGRVARGRPLPAIAQRRPLVIIRFDRPNVAYEPALYSAVRRALERRPDATFDLVAVTPNAGTPAQVALHSDASKRNAENVMRSLTSMGLAADRISLSATTSTTVQSNEVQVYVR